MAAHQAPREVPEALMHIVHKFGVAVTIVLMIVGFWDVRGIYDSELFEHVAMPILGIMVFCGGLKLALNRA